MGTNAGNPRNQPRSLTIPELYPNFTAEEHAAAEDTLRRYVQLVWRIHRRLRREKSETFDEKPFKR